MKKKKLDKYLGKPEDKRYLDIEYFDGKFYDISDQIKCLQKALANHRRDFSSSLRR